MYTISDAYNNSVDSEGSISDDPLFLFKKSSMLHKKNSTFGKTKVKKTSSSKSYVNNFDLQRYNPSDRQPSSYDNGINKQLEDERLLLTPKTSKFNSNDMTYGLTDKKNFFHINMNPQLNKGAGKGFEYDTFQQTAMSNGRQRIMETFTGNINSPSYSRKSEQRPLFNPIISTTNIFGSPNMTEKFVERVNPGKEKRNELPFAQIRETPGLNLNFNEDAPHGLHDPHRSGIKTIDDLRIASKPQISIKIPVINGMKGTRRGVINEVPKNKPETFRTNKQSDMTRSLSYYRAPAIAGEMNVPDTNRMMTQPHSRIQSAKYEVSKHIPESLKGQVSKSSKKEVEQQVPGNPNRNNGAVIVSKKAFTKNATQRMNYEESKRVNSAATLPKQRAFNYNETVAPTHRNNNCTQQRLGISTNNDKNYSVNYNLLKPKETSRQTYENNTNIGSQHMDKGNVVFNKNDNTPEATKREMYENSKIIGSQHMNIGTITFNEKNNTPEATNREIYENNKVIGSSYMGTGNIMFNEKNNIPNATNREIYENNKVISSASYTPKSYAFNQKLNIQKPTARQQYQNVKYISSTSGNNKLPCFDYSTKLDPTLRDITSDKTRNGGANYYESMKGAYQSDHKNVNVSATNRQTTQNTKYINSATLDIRGSYQINQKNINNKPTTRQLIQNARRISPIFGEIKGSHQINHKNTQAKNTNRQIFQNNKYISSVNSYNKKGSHQINQKNTQAKITKKQMFQSNKYIPTLSLYNKKGSHQINHKNTQAKITKKQMFQSNKYIPTLSLHNKKGSHQINQKNINIKGTMRQLTQNTKRLNPSVMSSSFRPATREDVNNMLTNDAKDNSLVIRDGGMPTPSNYNKIPTNNGTEYRLKEEMIKNRDTCGDYYSQNPYDTLDTDNYPKGKEEIENDTTHFYTFPEENLKNNVFINNVLHKSSEEL